MSKNGRKSKTWMLLPIVVALGYIPMLMHSYTYSAGLSAYNWFPDGGDAQIDFFLYYKMVAIILVGIVMCILLIYQYISNKALLRWENAWYCLTAYAVLAFLSALFSQYRSMAFNGGYEVFESIWVILGYVIFCFYTYQMIQEEKDVRFVARWAVIGITIITIIGFFQFFGMDLFRTTFGKKLISDPYMWDGLDSLTFTFPLGVSYTTLYNTNYLAFYYGLIIPILVVLVLFSKEKIKKIICAVLLILCSITMIGSNSKAALLALGITFVLGCIVLFRYLKKYLWVLIVSVLVMGGILYGYANRMGGLAGLYKSIAQGVESNSDEYAIKDIDTLEDEVVFHFENKELHISYSASEEGQAYIIILDENGNTVPTKEYDLGLAVTDDSYGDCTVTPIYIEDMISLKVSIDGCDWYFSNQIDGTYYYYNGFGKFDKFPDVQKSDLFPDSIISGRGELWNYLVPKLKSCLILGTGANTFVMEYPNNNYLLKNYTQSTGQFDVKAHNLYFQQFLENGLLALLAFIAFYIWYFVKSFKLYRKVSDFSFSATVGLGIMLGTFDYMLVGISNDSNVNTAPVFWILLGAGVAINTMVAKQELDK